MKKITLILLLLMPFVNAEILINFDERINSVQAIEKSNYYLDYYLSGEQESDYSFDFHYLDETINFPAKNSMYTIANLDISRLYRIDLLKNNEIADSILTNFCNYDLVCENNLTKGIFENELTCTDCEKSSTDGFCKIADDNICDPDCTGYNYDEMNGKCLEEYFISYECDNYCDENEFCSDDVFISQNGICCTGECVKKPGDFCKDYLNGTVCSETEMCNGQEINYEEGKTCCYSGQCETEKNEDYYNITLINDETKTKDLSIYFIIGIFASLVLLIIGLHYKNLSIVIASSLFFILMLSFLLLGSQTSITGKATANVLSQEEQNLILSSPSIFTYSGQLNVNLFIALKSISSEFKKQNVEFSENLLIATVTTLEKEVGGENYAFMPVEEGGDYCAGPNSKYTIGGRRRSEPYYGGCDYKGRGYIQVTHYSGYLKYCGPDCVSSSTTGNIIDTCGCVKEWFCKKQDPKECPPAKAKLPEHAGRIFANFYIGKGLLGFVEAKNYQEVGYRINGNWDVYGKDFNDKAKAKHNSYNKDQVRKLLAYFNQGRTISSPITSTPTTPSTGTDEDLVSVDSSVTTDVADEIISGDKLGYYYLNPSFKIESELAFIPTLIEEASDYDSLINTLKKYNKLKNEDTNEDTLNGNEINGKWIIGGCGETKKIDEESTKFILCVDDGIKKLEFAVDLEGKSEEKIRETVIEDEPVDLGLSQIPQPTENYEEQPIEKGFERIFSGITYGKFIANGPIVYYVLKIDLTNPNIKFLVTPEFNLRQKTSSFLANNKLQVAINGDEFNKATFFPDGLSMSKGNIYGSSKESGEQTFFISNTNDMSIGNKIPEGTLHAVSGNHVLLVNGQISDRIICSEPKCTESHPRTSVGVSQDKKTMIIITVDGRRTGHSIGIKLQDLAKFHRAYGSYNAISLDGGGSSTLVIEGKGIINHPSDPPDEYLNDANLKNQLAQFNGVLVHPDKNIYKERTVSNHLGIYAAPKSSGGGSKPVYVPTPVDTSTQSKPLPQPEYKPSYAISNDITAYPGIPINAPIKNSVNNRNPDAYNEVINQFKVDKNPRYVQNKKNIGDTYCNIFAWDVTTAMGAEIPHYRNGQELNANALYDWLESEGPKYGWKKVDEKTAQEYANRGKPAVASKKNEGGIGHIAVIRPGEITNKGATIAQAGSVNFNYGTIGQGFYPTNGIAYYVHE